MKNHHSEVNFDKAPFLVIWETTRACALTCKHCRAEAMTQRDPRELSTEEGMRLLDETAEMKTPIFIFSGGDALNREDLGELIQHGKGLGLRMGAIPAASSLLTAERVLSLKDAGLSQIAFSLDAPTAELHDRFRGVEGAFTRTLGGVAFAHRAGLPVQINTCIAAWNYPHLEAMIQLMHSLDIAFWEVFFLVPMGRGANMEAITPDQYEIVFSRLHRLNDEAKFVIKVTEAQHYRRFVIQKEMANYSGGEDVKELHSRIEFILGRPRGIQGGMGLSPQSVNSGKGIVFVDHIGNIYPSGFLPIAAGNLREQKLTDIYRQAPLFKRLRDYRLLKGKCGRCEYSLICGGSRARAFAASGDALAEDPSCAYIPK
jgi:radical SAM protein